MVLHQKTPVSRPRAWIGFASGLLVAAAVLRLAASSPQAPAGVDTPTPTPGQIEFFQAATPPGPLATGGDCHGGDDKGGLKLESRETLLKGGDTGPAIVPGDPGKSLLMHVLRRDEGYPAMPKKAEKLSDAKIAAFAEWIKA